MGLPLLFGGHVLTACDVGCLKNFSLDSADVTINPGAVLWLCSLSTSFKLSVVT